MQDWLKIQGKTFQPSFFTLSRSGQLCRQLKVHPSYLQLDMERKSQLQPKARKELTHEQMCGTKENHKREAIEGSGCRGYKCQSKGKWRQKWDSQSKQSNRFTVIQSDVVGIAQTSKACGVAS